LTIESTRQDIIPIQMLRGIAASMVVFVHLDIQLKRLGYGTLDAPWLGSGVDIFFVISGFIMWVSVARRPATSAGEFMRNRLIRIVPLYWLVSAGVLATTIVAPHHGRGDQIERGSAAARAGDSKARRRGITAGLKKMWAPSTRRLPAA